MKKNNLILILLSLFISACVYDYDPNISRYENLLVVDGQLTNLPGPYTVKLSRSYDYKTLFADKVTNAEVKIMDKTGLEVVLEETTDGIYSTIDTAFRGEIGHSYKLQIMLDNEIFETPYTPLQAAIPIDSVYWKYSDDKNHKGVQILIDTHDPKNNTHYYGWDYEETWEFHVPYKNYEEHPDWEICYKTARNKRLKIASTAQRNTDIVEKKSLQFIGEQTNRLYYRYTILAKQYALSESSYKYFSDLAKQNYSQGSLFDPIPGALSGNLKNVDSGVAALGYFLIAGASEQRIFIDRSELPKNYYPITGFAYCQNYSYNFSAKVSYEELIKTYPEIDSLIHYDGYKIYKEESIPNYGYIYNISIPVCYNCTLNGSNILPSFWLTKEQEDSISNIKTY